jgi:hypothetical protein
MWLVDAAKRCPCLAVHSDERLGKSRCEDSHTIAKAASDGKFALPQGWKKKIPVRVWHPIPWAACLTGLQITQKDQGVRHTRSTCVPPLTPLRHIPLSAKIKEMSGMINLAILLL